MGKMKVLQSSLNGGELTPRLKGRPELPRYQSGMELCENFIPFVLGGATSRPGTRLVAQALDSTEGHALNVYTSLDDSGAFRGFCIESNTEQLRAFKGYQVAATVENLNPAGFLSTQTDEFDSYLYQVSASSMPLRLKRDTDAAWAMELVPFTAQPFMRPPKTEDITLQPSALTGDIVLTASADFFQAGHVDTKLQVNGGIVKITAVTDATHANATIVENIPVPQGGGTTVSRTFRLIYTPPFDEGTPPDPPAFIGGPWDISCTATADFTTRSMSTTPPEVLPDGLALSISEVNGTLTGLEPDKKWKEQAWSELRGYPVAVTFFEQRMILAGSRSYPTTVWGSKSGDQLDFTIGTDDDAGFAWKLAAADTPIHSVKANERLNVFTATREITIDTGNDKPLSPTNFRIKVRTKQGSSASMPPVTAGSDLIYTSGSKKRLYSFLYRLDADRFVANDISIYGEHLVREAGGIEQVVVTREPHPMLWCRTAAGTIITLTWDGDQQVAAWARHTTGGTVTNIAAVPDVLGNDQVWLTVVRNGRTNVEAFDWELQTDSAVIGSDLEGKVTWDGLEHLEGKAVMAVADGFVVQGLTVQDGAVTLPYPAKAVEIGLPFVARIKDLPPAVAGSSGTISGQISVNQTQVLLDQTKGCMVNGERIPFQYMGEDLLDKPVKPFTGWKKVGGLGWGDSGSGGQVEIVRDLPLPCTVLAIAKEVTVNG